MPDRCSYDLAGERICSEERLPDSVDGLCILHERRKDKDCEEFEKVLRSRTQDFRGIYFPHLADFRKKKFSEADFEEGEFSEGANFDDAEFSRDANFGGAEFSGDAYFGGAVFSGDAYFRDAEFSRDANFGRAVFSGNAHFDDAEFSRDAYFGRAEFSEGANFDDAEFSRDAYFGRAEFSEGANFDDAEFSRDANFRDAEFSGNAYFRDAEFSRDAYFGRAVFSRDADFRGAEFLGEAIFKMSFASLFLVDAKFKDKVEISSKQRPERVDLADTRFYQGGRIGLDFSVPGVAKLKGADLEMVDLTECQWPPHFIVDPEERRTGKLPEVFGTRLSVERLKDLKDIYRRLKVSFQRAGDYSTSGEFYYRERECERRPIIAEPESETESPPKKKRMDKLRKSINRARDIGKHLFWQIFLRGLVGYGERPRNILFFSVIFVLLGSLWYYFGGISLVGKGIVENEAVRTIKYPTTQPIWDFLRCIYFSTVTFTTLGYGDIHPSDMSKWFAVVQAFIGMFMMALFAIVFGRKVMRG